MATRGAYGVKLDGKYILSYQHFDSYPDWLGKDICKFIHELNREHGWEEFRRNFSRVAMVYPGDAAPEEFVRSYSGHESALMEKGRVEWYNLLKGYDGGAIFRMIYRGKAAHFPDAGDFLQDPLCEYGYVVNLDEMTLEYYAVSGKVSAPDPAETKRSACRLKTIFPLAAVTELTYLEMID